MNSDLFEGNLQLIQLLLDVVQMISESDYYMMEVSNFYVKMLQLLSVVTWGKYPFHIGIITTFANSKIKLIPVSYIKGTLGRLYDYAILIYYRWSRLE